MGGGGGIQQPKGQSTMNKCRTCGWNEITAWSNNGDRLDTPEPRCLLWAELTGLAFKQCNGIDWKAKLNVDEDAKW